MTALTLQPLMVITEGDKKEKTAWITWGVTQRSPLSPTLFNMYIDSYTESMEKEGFVWSRSNGRERWEVTLLVNDVKIQTTSENLMNTSLRGSGHGRKQKE